MSAGKVSLCKQNSARNKEVDGGQRKGCTKSCDFGPMKYVKQVCDKVVATVVRIIGKNKNGHINDHPKERAKTWVAPLDSQRVEAIHDCIDFINSSASLPRSNSVAR